MRRFLIILSIFFGVPAVGAVGYAAFLGYLIFTHEPWCPTDLETRYPVRVFDIVVETGAEERLFAALRRLGEAHRFDVMIWRTGPADLDISIGLCRSDVAIWGDNPWRVDELVFGIYEQTVTPTSSVVVDDLIASFQAAVGQVDGARFVDKPVPEAR
jgi:hypothetical protein